MNWLLYSCYILQTSIPFFQSWKWFSSIVWAYFFGVVKNNKVSEKVCASYFFYKRALTAMNNLLISSTTCYQLTSHELWRTVCRPKVRLVVTLVRTQQSAKAACELQHRRLGNWCLTRDADRWRAWVEVPPRPAGTGFIPPLPRAGPPRCSSQSSCGAERWVASSTVSLPLSSAVSCRILVVVIHREKELVLTDCVLQ